MTPDKVVRVAMEVGVGILGNYLEACGSFSATFLGHGAEPLGVVIGFVVFIGGVLCLVAMVTRR